MELIRKGNEVYFNDRKLVINPQATKGPGNEVVKIDGLEGSNGQKWFSLSKLKEGKNTVETKSHERSNSVKVSNPKKVEYELTDDEKSQIKELESQIESIIQTAKDRYVPVPDMNFKPDELSEIEKLKKIIELKKYLGQSVEAEENELDELIEAQA